MGYFNHFATVSGGRMPHGWGISDIVVHSFGSVTYVFAGSAVDGGINRLSMASNGTLTLQQARPISNEGNTMTLGTLAVVEIGGTPYLLGVGRNGQSPALRELSPQTGELRGLVPFQATAEQLAGWHQVEAVTIGSRDYLVVSQWDTPGLRVFEIGPGFSLTQRSYVADSGKTTLSHVSALTTVEIGGAVYIIAACAQDSGVTSLRLHPNGRLEVVDMFSAAIGAGMNRSTSLATVEVMGEVFVIVGSAGTGTLTVLRINDLGVLFEADHVMDSLATRFGGVQDIAAFSHAGRSFIVAGGSDDGLALFEVGPGGVLYHLQSIEQRIGWTLDNVQAIETVMRGSVAHVLAAGETLPGMTQLSIPMARFGEVYMVGTGQDVTGTSRDDHLEAVAGNATLRGGAGDDRLVAGRGETQMWGGPGADLFVFRPGGGTDRIQDFEPGIDRIDLSAYPMLYSPAGLRIEETSNGARIRVGEDVIVIRSIDLTPLTAADFGQDDFVFS